MAGLRTSRRLLRSPILRACLVAFVIWNVLEVYYIRSSWRKPPTGRERFSRPPKVFVASLHWNDEDLVKEYWNDALLSLVEALGPDNVYVSIYESGSWDNTAFHLRALDQELGKVGVNRSIILDARTHEDEISDRPPAEDTPGWVMTPKGVRAPRRVPFLAKLRNKSMQPFHDLVAQGAVFDQILFLNDVVFKADDALELLHTNDGDYAAACSMDYSKAPYFYDTFALRDSAGHEHVAQTWPYFRSSASRRAMKLGVPVPVTSCWNGMVAMPADAFRSHDKESQSGLTFRGVDDSLAAFHLEGSECCLIHADNPLAERHEVLLNPRVRVGYNDAAYKAVNPDGPWLTSFTILTGLWRNRVQRWATAPFIAIKEWRVNQRVRAWELGTMGEKEEKGKFCLVNEMHIIVGNGWAHV